MRVNVTGKAKAGLGKFEGSCSFFLLSKSVGKIIGTSVFYLVKLSGLVMRVNGLKMFLLIKIVMNTFICLKKSDRS